METVNFVVFLLSGGLLVISLIKDENLKIWDIILGTIFLTSIVFGMMIQEDVKVFKRFDTNYEIDLVYPDSVYIKTEEGDVYKRKFDQLEETIENDNL